MKIPAELLYSTDHEWVKVENGKAIIGITDFAQDQLGDVVFVKYRKQIQKLMAATAYPLSNQLKLFLMSTAQFPVR